MSSLILGMDMEEEEIVAFAVLVQSAEEAVTVVAGMEVQSGVSWESISIAAEARAREAEAEVPNQGVGSKHCGILRWALSLLVPPLGV
jgi:hypothetical protein